MYEITPDRAALHQRLAGTVNPICRPAAMLAGAIHAAVSLAARSPGPAGFSTRGPCCAKRERPEACRAVFSSARDRASGEGGAREKAGP